MTTMAFSDRAADQGGEASPTTISSVVVAPNAAFFDAVNAFAGCVVGLHDVLCRQGLLKNILCLDPHETLGQGQIRRRLPPQARRHVAVRLIATEQR